MYVYYLYFSEKKGKRTAAKEKRTAARGKEQEKNRKKKTGAPAQVRRSRPLTGEVLLALYTGSKQPAEHPAKQAEPNAGVGHLPIATIHRSREKLDMPPFAEFAHVFPFPTSWPKMTPDSFAAAAQVV